MVRWILGTAGSGKSTQVLREAGEKAQQGKRVLLLVPEQYSLETEKAMSRNLDPAAALHVEVYSFTRLCEQIFRQLGGAAHQSVSDAGRYLVMNMALEQLKGDLGRYEKSRQDGAQIAALTRQMEEFRTMAVTPELLREAKEKIMQPSLEEKIDDILRIYEIYDGLLTTVLGERGSLLENGLSRLKGSGLFAGYEVFVDSFKGFMAAELAILEEIICTAENVTFALCTDSLYDETGGYSIFSPVCQTAGRLMQIARKNGISVERPKTLQHGRRFSKTSLAHMEQNLFRQTGKTETDSKGIRLVQAEEPYREMQWTAAQISHLVRSGVCRYRDIVVIGRSLPDYEQAIRTAFRDYQISYYMDRRFDVGSQPLTVTVLSLLDAVRTRWRSEELFRLLKGGLMDFSAEETAWLEEYAFVWDISGARWENPFTLNPSGFGKMTPRDEKRLEQVEHLRKKLMDPLVSLRQKIAECSGKQLVSALYLYLKEAGVFLRLKEQEKDLSEQQRDDVRALFDGMMDLWDQYASVLGDSIYPLSRHCELMRLTLESADLGQISQSLDCVSVGSAERIRPHGPKYLFLIGANEDVFPAPVGRDGVLSEREREQLGQVGVEVTEPFETRVMEERYYAYTALTCASEGVFVSWSCENGDGAPLSESMIVRQLRQMFDEIPTTLTAEESVSFYAVNHKTALSAYGRQFDKNTPQAAALGKLLREGPLQERYQRICEPVRPEEYVLSSQETARALFGKTMRMSPSKVDRFHQCRFAYFCERGLGVRAPRKAELSPMESGTVVHYVLQQITSRYPGKALCDLSEETIREMVRQYLDDYLQEAMGGEPEKTARFKYLFTRMSNTLVRLIRHLALEFSVTQFEAVAFEMPIAENSSVTPLRLQTPDGADIWVEGIVDRVDVMKKGDKRFVRVVDYKTGTKTFDFTDIYYGINLQMLIYLFSICQNGKDDMADLIPAGVLYMPGKAGFLSADRHADQETMEKKQKSTLKMNGLVLADPGVLEGMEAGANGVFIPAKLKNGAIDAKSSVATLAQLGKLKKHIESLLLQMAKTLWSGQIQALPLEEKQYDMCAGCAYRGVCGREEDGKVRLKSTFDRDAFFQEIGGEEDGR